MVRGDCNRLAAVKRNGGLLDGRRISYGCQTLFRISADRRSASRSALPSLIRQVYRGAPVAGGFLLRDILGVLYRYFSSKISHRAFAYLSAPCGLIYLVFGDRLQA